mmetsp:Transcript_1097/g.2367  ORF Transcript_1097/g.2367 Transcript_1097/m.2367 type:complete len:234 (-) Transcript_1097:527-1228(-)
MSPNFLSVLYSIITARYIMLGNDGSAAIMAPDNCHATLGQNLTCIPSQQQQQCREPRYNHLTVLQASKHHLVQPGCMVLRSQMCREPQSTLFVTDASMDNEDYDSSDELQQSGGSLVELYGEGSYFATPAIITGRYKKTPSMKYNLKHATTNAVPTSVNPEFIHPYQVYEDGKEASCNMGAFRDGMYSTTPCTIDSHSVRGGGFIFYNVSYLNEENELVQKRLHFSKVQRILI